MQWLDRSNSQYHNEATLDVEMDGKTTPVKGYMFTEASFVSP